MNVFFAQLVAQCVSHPKSDNGAATLSAFPKTLAVLSSVINARPAFFPRSTPVAAAVVLDKRCLLLYVTAWHRPIIVISRE